ncbi:MAG: hypothetical protein ABI305_04580 [Tepidiformaceae bacterium]
MGNDAAAAAKSFNAAKSASDTDVNGVGDAAYIHQGNDPNSLVLNVRKGTKGFGVNVYTARGGATNRDLATVLAQIILPRE